MPKNINITTFRNDLSTIPAPLGSGIMEHKDVAVHVITELGAIGYTINKEEYRISVNQDVVQGVLHLSHSDNDILTGLMFTWVNSYDKTTGFRCEMGAYSTVKDTELYAELDSKVFRRNSTDLVKHTREYIQDRIIQGHNNFKDFIAIRDKFIKTTVSEKEAYSLIGMLFFNDAITSSQLISIKHTYDFAGPVKNGLWDMWCAIASTFKSSHPKAWFKQQTAVAKLLIDAYITTPVLVNPAQISLMDAIENDLKVMPTGELLNIVPPAGSFHLPHYWDDDVEVNEPETFGIQSDIGNQIDAEIALEKEAQPAVLSLEAYDLAVKDSNEIEAVNLVEDAKEEIIEEPVIDETPIFNLDTYEASDVPIPPVVEEEEEEETFANLGDFPEIPKDIPIFTLNAEPVEEPSIGHMTEISWGTDAKTMQDAEESLVKELNESKEEIIPLEDQVAGAELQPVSEEEIQISAKPVVDKPLVIEGKLQPNADFDNDSKEKTLESPNFEF